MVYYVKVSATAAALVLQAVPQAYGYDSSLTTHSSLAMESKDQAKEWLKWLNANRLDPTLVECSCCLVSPAEGGATLKVAAKTCAPEHGVCTECLDRQHMKDHRYCPSCRESKPFTDEVIGLEGTNQWNQRLKEWNAVKQKLEALQKAKEVELAALKVQARRDKRRGRSIRSIRTNIQGVFVH